MQAATARATAAAATAAAAAAVAPAVSASAASASAAAAAWARRRGSACGRGCDEIALSSTIRGCGQAFVMCACKQAACVQVRKQHWQWQDQAVDSKKGHGKRIWARKKIAGGSL